MLASSLMSGQVVDELVVSDWVPGGNKDSADKKLLWIRR